MAIRVSLPAFDWEPRPDQMDVWTYLRKGGKRADICAHRRWGKDEICLQHSAISTQERIGTYWHMLPEASQARKAIWDAVNPRTGRRRIDEAFPKELRATTRDTEMFIRFKNGSTWQVLGSDNFNSFVGSPPIGVTFSEWSLANPFGWSYVRPILLENNGTALFIWTPRGRNHATRAFESRAKDSEWFTQKLSAEYTGVFTKEQLAKELQEMIDEAGSVQEGTALFNQEYLVDFDAPVPGAYFAENIKEAADQGRIGEFPYNPRWKVYTCWDLGIDDYTAIWFFQKAPDGFFNFFKYYEASGIGLDDLDGREGIVTESFKGSLSWKFGMHYLPHDVKVRELGSGGRTRRQTLHSLGVSPIRVGVPRNPQERVNATRRFIGRCRFDETGCAAGIERLKQFKKRWNKSLNVYTGELHDENSHGAHALGEAAMNSRELVAVRRQDDGNPHDRYASKKSIFATSKGQASSWKTV